MSAGRKVEPPQKPQDGESLRKHISFRTRNELYHFISQIDLNVSELAHVLGVNENTFKALQQGSRDRLPTAEMLFTLYQINFMSEFVHVPRRNGWAIDIFYIVTGERATANPVALSSAKEQIEKQKEEIEKQKEEIDALRKTLISLARRE